MTNEQADEIYRGLTEILHEERLSWIADEVQTAIAIGKTETSEFEMEGADEGRRGRQVTMLRHSQRDWTPQERLAMLLEAVDAAVCKPITSESDVITLLPELEGREIAFAPGGFAEELPEELWREGTLRVLAMEAGDPNARPYQPYAIHLDERRHKRRQQADALLNILQSVRSELDADLD